MQRKNNTTQTDNNVNSNELGNNSRDTVPVCAKLRYVWVALNPKVPLSLFLIDSGASVSVLSKYLYDKLPENTKPVLRPNPSPLKAGNNTSFKTYGCATFKFTLQGMKFSHRF